MALASVAATDAELMRRAQSGERAAFGDLYGRLSARAYRVAAAVCHDDASAQEAVQDAFAAMWSARATYQPARGDVAGWAMAVVRNRAIRVSRRRAAEAGRTAGDTRERAAPDDVEAEAAARADARDLRKLLHRLPTAQREVIALGFYGGFTHEEIAERLSLPPGTVKGRMRLGLRKLRDDIGP
jgi:RNA polymerase sigma-70 factor (ECF subfamily)